jgi:hypothetical protein
LNLPRFWKTLLCILFIFIISAVPGQSVPDIPIWNFDKLVHSFIYFWLTFSLYHDLKSVRNFSGARYTFIIWLAGPIAYGGLLEILQNFIFINRSGNWVDFWANTFGVIGAAVFVKSFKKTTRSSD